MAPKTTTNKWSDVQLAIAAISMTSVIAFWNMFAGPDKVKADEKALAEQQVALVPTITPTPEIVEIPTIVATMPPKGYTILFGGEAPKPQIIVVAQPKKNNGGNEANSSGDGNNTTANQPATSTGSS